MVEMQDSSELAQGLLTGIRVVELGRRIAAPLAAMVLAEQGAEVLRIVDRSNASQERVLDAILARGKTEIHLDLDAENGRATLKRLIARADVVIENQHSRVTAELGMDFDRIRDKANPRLISCSIPAFPQGDPRSELPDHEAISGMAGFLYEKPLGKPLYHDFPVGSVMAGLFAANAIVAALIARHRNGRGQHIETSLFESNLFSQVIQILVKTGVPRGFLPFKMLGTPFMGPWLCGDRRYIYLHITLPAHNARILEMIEGIGYASEVKALRAVISPETARDPSQVKSIAEAKKIRELYSRIFLTRSAMEWEKILGDELCCIKIRTIEEWLDDSIAAGMTDACRIQDPVFGELTAPGATISSPDRPPVIRPRTSGDLDLSALLARWESDARTETKGLGDIEDQAGTDTKTAGGPLEGIRVFDLSRVIAGPCAARVLAELGAEVLSLQSPSSLDWALSFHLVFNAGKRSATLDFSTDEGKARLWKILDDFHPHAFIQNYRHLDIARAIGIDPDSMRNRFPSIAYTHLNAYGNEGAWKDRPGFEQVVQAVSGIQMSYGRNGRPRLLPTPIIDIGSGLLGSFATLLGLYRQVRTGQGTFATTHLTQMSVLLQINRVAAYQEGSQVQATLAKGSPAYQEGGQVRVTPAKGAPVEPEPDGDVVAGIFRVLDGYALVVGPPADLETWVDHAGLDQRIPIPRGIGFPGRLRTWIGSAGAGHGGTASRPRGLSVPGSAPERGRNPSQDPLDLPAWRMLMKPLAHWQRSLVAAGVSDRVCMVPNPSMRTLIEDLRKLYPGAIPPVRKRHFPGCPQPLTFVRNPVHFSLNPVVDVNPPPMRGEHTREVLARIGESVPVGTGVVPYPGNKPFLVWLASLVRWGYFSWKSGNI